MTDEATILHADLDSEEKNVEHALGHGRDHHVHRDGEGRKPAGVVPGWDVRLSCSCRHDPYRCTRVLVVSTKTLSRTSARSLAAAPRGGDRCAKLLPDGKLSLDRGDNEPLRHFIDLLAE
jgi:hypothetical protein